VLAERLLLDLGEANSRTEAAMLLAQALRAIGGADGVRILRRDPDHGSQGPALVLAESGNLVAEESSTVTDRESGLELTVCGAEVPPVSVSRSLRALATVLERVADQERLLTEARTDPLTGLLNRRALDERLESELARQERAGGPVSLVLIDIDHFKSINDQHGHARGDEVLQGVADAMRDVARTADVLGRIGGDEFALLLADTGEGGAWVASNRLCDRIRRHGVTASLGAVTAVAGSAWTVGDLLRAADEALYEAKRAGRDRAVTTWGIVGA
jgi:diguanylate cyclase (GGDEF)-like protein